MTDLTELSDQDLIDAKNQLDLQVVAIRSEMLAYQAEQDRRASVEARRRAVRSAVEAGLIPDPGPDVGEPVEAAPMVDDGHVPGTPAPIIIGTGDIISEGEVHG